MKATGKWLAVLAMLMAINGQALAEAGKPRVEAVTVKTAAWDRVGDTGAAGPGGVSSRAQAPGEDGLQARKADMVRRMFWIMMAHR